MPTQAINSSRQGTPLVALRPGSGTNPRLVNGPHGLPARPDWVSISLECKLADRGFSVGDTAISPRGENPIAWADDTNLYVAFSVNGQWVTSKTGANAQRINEDRWDWTITPYLVQTVNALTSIDASEVIGVLDSAPVDADRGKAWIIDPTDRTKIALQALLTVADMDGRIEAWARSGNTDGFPVAKILAAIQGTRTTADRGKLVAVKATDEDGLELIDPPTPGLSQSEVDARVDAQAESAVLDAAKGTRTTADRGKLLATSSTDEDALDLVDPLDPGLSQTQVDARVDAGAAEAVLDSAQNVRTTADRGKLIAVKSTDEDKVELVDAPTPRTDSEIDSRVSGGVQPWARAANTDRIPVGKLPAGAPPPPAAEAETRRYQLEVPDDGPPVWVRVQGSSGGGGGGTPPNTAVTPATVKARLPSSRGLADSAIQSAIDAASARIEAVLGFPTAAGEIEVITDGGISALFLPRKRRTSSTTVRVWKEAPSASDDREVGSTQFDYREGPPRLTNTAGYWGEGTYRIVYDAASIETQTDEITLRLVALRLTQDGLLKIEDAEYREWRRYTDSAVLEADLLKELPISPILF